MQRATSPSAQLLAFLFLVNLFTQPVQQATEILNELQNAVAGWRRVIGVIDTPADVADPGDDGQVLPRGPDHRRLRRRLLRLPRGDTVLHDVNLAIGPRSRVAIVGETGSGKSTLAKLLTRLMDPTEGTVRIDGVDLRDVRFSSLRERVVLVPQEGFLFDATLRENVRFGRPDATDEDVTLALTELGLDAWLAGLPQGLATEVGQRGESLSAGERQLVALARAYLADPDLLVLDEATSRRRPLHRGAPPARARGADPRAHLGRHRPPAVDGRGRRRGRRRRPRPHRASAARTASWSRPAACMRRCTPPGRPSSAADRPG